MNSPKNDQTNNVAVWPEKLYTQKEVDALRIHEQVESETQTAAKQIRLDNITVANLVKKSNRILVSLSSHAFPLDLFPDTLNVEESRITVINRHLLYSEVHSVDIKDISNIFLNKTIFFSQLVIISKTFEDNEVRIRNLYNKEAIFARRIIEGLRIFINKQIDTSSYTNQDLIAKLQELSTTAIVT